MNPIPRASFELRMEKGPIPGTALTILFCCLLCPTDARRSQGHREIHAPSYKIASFLSSFF